jgi:hypothetical protein
MNTNKPSAAYWSNIHYICRFDAWACRHMVASDFLRVTELICGIQ